MPYLLASRFPVVARLVVIALFAILATEAGAQSRSGGAARVEAASSAGSARMALDTYWSGTRVWVGAMPGAVVVRLSEGRDHVDLTFSPEAVRTWAARPGASELTTGADALVLRQGENGGTLRARAEGAEAIQLRLSPAQRGLLVERMLVAARRAGQVVLG